MNPDEQLALIRRQVADTWQRLRGSFGEIIWQEFAGDFVERSRRRAERAAKPRSRTVAAVVLAALSVPAALVLIPYRGFNGTVTLIIEPGLGRRAIATRLVENRVLLWRWPFLIYSALRPGSTLKAGEYRFDRARSPAGVFSQLATGSVFQHPLTVPEGWTRWEIAAEVARLGLAEREEFLRVAENADLIADLAPKARTLEGYLFPDTYYISRPTSAEAIARMMVGRFRQVLHDMNPGPGTSNRTLHEVVTLASMVEEETGAKDERGLIAGVYANRLRRGMRMQCDPTVIYAARLANGGEYDGIIHQSDLDRRSPYNTYRVSGLPPGPIASPGRAALAAAFDPPETDYLFFVADAEGGHAFARTGGQHVRNVRRYRQKRLEPQQP